MRANTIRSTVRFGMMVAAFAGISFAGSTAHAQGDVDESGTTSAPNSSLGSAALHYEQGKGLETSISTGFMGPSIAQMNVGIKIDPVVNGGPLFAVDMPKGANIEADWGSDKKIILKAQTDGSTDGNVTVRHTLTPSVDLKLSVFGLQASFSYDADKLINMIPGSRFNYDSRKATPFAPWGFTAVPTNLDAPDLNDAQLFSMDMANLPDFVSQNITGNFGVRAVTKPTFTYQTTKITISGADGQISDGTSQLTLDASDGDFLEVMAAVEGNMDIKGGLSVQPFVHLDSVAGQTINTDVQYDVYTKDYTTPTTKCDFQTVLVHIPMPNVRKPNNVDLGTVTSGETKTKTVTISNTGEKDATFSLKSANAAFAVDNGTLSIPAKGTKDVTVTFTASGSGSAESDITIASNDADSPFQTFKVGANGADVSEPATDGNPDHSGVKNSDGCGCKATGHSSTPGWAGFGALAFGAAVFFRRRRAAK
jgi:MYXO-CTERM domain-containing protein